MNEAKHFLMSKTIWGVLISLAGVVMSKFGLTPFDEATAQTLAGEIVSMIGAVVVVIGRITAQTSLKAGK